MIEGNKRWLRAIGTMIGAIVGIGVFGIPYAFAQAGFLVGLIELVVIGVLLILLQMLYAEVTIVTPGHKRLTGLAGKYLGKKWRWFVTFTLFSTAWGAMMAYIIVAGDFMFELLGPSIGGTPFIYSVGFMTVESLFLLAGLRKISGAETYIVGILLLIFGAIIALGLPEIQVSNIVGVNFANATIPYGIVLFALAGMGIVPEMHEILGEKHERRLLSAVMIAMGIIIVLYALFAFVVVGVTGSGTSEEAISGLGTVLGPTVGMLGSLLGIITLVSIFVIVGIQVKDALESDYKVKPLLAWLITVSVPITLFLLGVREFITVLSFTGAVFGAMTGIVVVVMYEKMRKTIGKKEKVFSLPRWVLVLISSIFILGALAEIIKTIV